jgi:hypothetical protein
MKKVSKRGRPKIKGSAMLFNFRPECEKFIRDEAEKTGKTMVRILEEIIVARSKFKPEEWLRKVA